MISKKLAGPRAFMTKVAFGALGTAALLKIGMLGFEFGHWLKHCS